VLQDRYVVLAGGLGAKGFVSVLDLRRGMGCEWECRMNDAVLPDRGVFWDCATAVVVEGGGGAVLLHPAPSLRLLLRIYVDSSSDLAFGVPLEPSVWPPWVYNNRVLQ